MYLETLQSMYAKIRYWPYCLLEFMLYIAFSLQSLDRI